MSNLTNAADQVLALAAQYQAIIDLANEVKGIASIDQATDEAKARLAAARADEGKAVTAFRVAAAKVEDATAERDRILADADARATVVLAAAAVDAKDIEARAKATAASIVASAKDATNARLAAAGTEVKKANGATEAAKAELAVTNAALAAAQGELDAVQGKLDAAKASIAKLLG